jgi:hypothetical protein
MSIYVTKHALQQYRYRILFNDNLPDELVIENIKNIFVSSRYISDNEKGILFRNKDLNIEFIVKKGRIVTLFPIMNKKKGGKNGNAGKSSK